MRLHWGGVFTFFACSNGDDDNNVNGDNAKSGIVARMTTVTSELTFYEDKTFEFKEDDAARSIQARAVTANAASSSGTYSGDVLKDGAEISLSFTSGKRKGKEGTAKVNERDDASNVEMKIGDEDLTLERIQALVTAWRTGSGKTVYFYNDSWAMQVIKEGDKPTCHPLVYTGDAGKNGTVQLAFLDGTGSQAQARSKDALVYENATISGSTMTYDKETYTKISNDRNIVTAWRATTEEDGKKFLETMYFYNDGTFMIVMNKIANDQITNGFAGTYTGDTTKDGTVSATIGERNSTGTIKNNELAISKPEEITYERIN